MASYLPTPKSKKPSQKPAAPPPPEPVAAPPPLPVETVTTKPEAPAPVLRRSGLPDWLRGSLTGLFIAIALLAGFLVFSYTRSIILNKGLLLNPFVPTPNSVQTTGAQSATSVPIPMPPPAANPWNGVGRVTILVMGLDARDVGDDCTQHPNLNAPARSDSMLVMSLDPATKTASVLSIPRDLYVEIPGYGFDRINTAYFLGATNHYPDPKAPGGPGLAIKTVENLIGIPIDYFAVIDFNAFASMVDEIGGIDIDIAYDNMQIAPCGHHIETLFQGKNHLNGPEALAYARNRHASLTGTSEGSDFDRAARQQQVIFAIRDKVISNWVSLLPKVSTLYNTLAAGIYTNLTLDNYFSLAWIAKDVSKENIRTGVIGPDQLLALDTVSDQQVLIPNYDKIRALRNKVFDTGVPVGYNITPPANLVDLAAAEHLKIAILNGSGKTGLAAATKDYLVQHGFADADISTGNASGETHSKITDFTGSLFSNSARYLIKLMGITPGNISYSPNMDSQIDLQITLGADWVVPQT